MKPIFSANHHWAMARGEESLLLELERRRAATPEALALVPAPPGSTPAAGPLLAGAAAAVAAIGLWALWRRGRSARRPE
jgi:hypothetical protein